MGMLINGRWTDRDDIIENGRFRRQASRWSSIIGADVVQALSAEPGRFWLIGSYSCPWSHRTMILRQLKGLTKILPLHIAHGPRIQGYAVNGGGPWRAPGSDREIVHLHELYTLSDNTFSGRSTVPILWDGGWQCIVSNDSAAIMRGLDAVAAAGDIVLAPDHLLVEIDTANARIYRLNNGVYRAGFAERQEAYEEAVEEVFAILDELESRLSDQRYLLGAVITEADWRLFPTLVRFDSIYYILHKCCRRRLVDYPRLWDYARDLFAWQGIAETVNFDVARQASYANDTSRNGNGIVAIAPEADWLAPHGRERFGAARIGMRGGGTVVVEPTGLKVVGEVG